MFCFRVNENVELRLINRPHAADLFAVMDRNREHLGRWHPWVAKVRSAADVERLCAAWQQMFVLNQMFHAGIWHKGELCGMINHQNVDWTNRFAVLSYWLAAEHQGKGIMTECCRAMIAHAFGTWKLNRITIECAAENTRSRAIAERLGFKFEGIIRGAEWLHDRYVDHAIYGMLHSDYVAGLLAELKKNMNVRQNDVPSGVWAN